MSLIQEKTFVFIIGSPRSGTTWLHHILAAHADVASIPEELCHFNRYIHPLRNAWKEEKGYMDDEKWNQGYPTIMEESEFEQITHDLTEKVYGKVLAKNPSASHILDKHPGYTHFTEDILAILPNAKFIHIIRDGREAAVSMLAAQKKVGFGAKTIWNAAVEWKKSVETAHDFATKNPAQSIELHYADLEANPKEKIKTVLAFLNLDTSNQTLEQLTGADSPVHQRVSAPDQKNGPENAKWLTLSLKERFLLEEVAGETLRKHGYAENPKWWSVDKQDGFNMSVYKTARSFRKGFLSLFRSK